MRAKSSFQAMMFIATLLAASAANLRAQSQASDLSMAPVALSIEGGALSVEGGVSALVGGVAFTVKSVKASANGSVIVVENLSDATEVTIEVSADVTGRASKVVGKTATISTIAAGMVLAASGEVLAFIPNEIGRALLHNEQITP